MNNAALREPGEHLQAAGKRVEKALARARAHTRHWWMVERPRVEGAARPRLGAWQEALRSAQWNLRRMWWGKRPGLWAHRQGLRPYRHMTWWHPRGLRVRRLHLALRLRLLQVQLVLAWRRLVNVIARTARTAWRWLVNAVIAALRAAWSVLVAAAATVAGVWWPLLQLLKRAFAGMRRAARRAADQIKELVKYVRDR